MDRVLDAKTCRLVNIIHVSPIKTPVRFKSLGFKLISQTSTRQYIILFFKEPWEITAIRVISITGQETEIPVIIDRQHILFLRRGPEILQRISLSDAGLTSFTTFKLVPSIIRNAITILVLTHPHDTTFTPMFTKRVPHDIKISLTFTIIFNAMVKLQDKITAPSSQRSYPRLSSTAIQRLLY